MKRQHPIEIEVKKHGENWAVYAEKKLVAIAVYRKGAITLEALLRLLIRYTSRNLFRQALEAALTAKETDVDQKAAKAPDAKPKPAKKKGDQNANKTEAADASPATDTTETATAAETATSAPDPSANTPVEPAPAPTAEPSIGPASTGEAV